MTDAPCTWPDDDEHPLVTCVEYYNRGPYRYMPGIGYVCPPCRWEAVMEIMCDGAESLITPPQRDEEHEDDD